MQGARQVQVLLVQDLLVQQVVQVAGGASGASVVGVCVCEGVG